MKVVSLWSGGKDSAFAFWKTLKDGYDVLALFNFTKGSGKKSLSHNLSSEIISEQGRLLDIPLIQKAMPEDGYRKEFKNLISKWRDEKGIEGIVFGDIYLEEHKDWIDRVCSELRVEAVMPLWKKDTKDLICEFVNSGFRAIVVSAKADLARELLGLEIDKEFIGRLKPDVDPCGENGEFHTFVFDGPIFKAPVKFKIGKKILKKDSWFLEIKKKGEEGIEKVMLLHLKNDFNCSNI